MLFDEWKVSDVKTQESLKSLPQEAEEVARLAWDKSRSLALAETPAHQVHEFKSGLHLLAFANEVISLSYEGIDHFDIQELALRYGLIAPVTVTQSCGDHCSCVGIIDFPGECYKKTNLLQTPDSIKTQIEEIAKKAISNAM